ncbi:MAG: hypothetical protein MUC38_14055 [Cyclobacteriaceae bacterium]|nr:hypothetical protein [Cyclobacteriaceae bacterium]
MWAACTSGGSAHQRQISRLDSLTETYLHLHDTVLFTWNSILRDEQQKIAMLNELIGRLETSQLFDEATLASLRTRLEQLERIHLTPKTLANPDVVDEYDFASAHLIVELTTLFETNTALLNHPDWQQLIDEVKTVDMRGSLARDTYDSLAWQLNRFIEEHLDLMPDIAPQSGLERANYFK